MNIILYDTLTTYGYILDAAATLESKEEYKNGMFDEVCFSLVVVKSE
jgi:hypothetical protein